MATIQNSENNLYWVFTEYGKKRLANFEPNDHLFLYKACIGGYDWYTDENQILGATGYSEAAFKRYFTHSGDNVTLGEPITNGVVPINSKSLEGTVVTLTITIPETLNGFDIRELGIYETIGDIDYLFAVCTMQPIPKPSTNTNHIMSVQFNARLDSRNLSQNYEQIVLDPENNFATLDDVNNFQENMLFVEATLAEQINNNTARIGLNRPQQLFEQIEADKKKYSSFVVSTTYANFLNATALENVKSFWVFNKTNDLTRNLSIADIGYYGTNLATNRLISQYEQGYEGLASYINFTGKDFYQLASDIDFDLLNKNGENVVDSEFTIFFVGSQNSNDEDCTILAKDNGYTTQPAFRLAITKDRQVRLRLYTTPQAYLEFLSSKGSVPAAGNFYVLAVSYSYTRRGDVLLPTVKMSINARTINSEITRVGSYRGMQPTELPLTSFLATTTEIKDYINSKVCILSVVKDKLSEDYVRATMYNLMALIGRDPCLIQ